MSIFDYFWNIEMDKDGISFSDAIDKFKLTRDKALECLKCAGHPVNSDDEMLSLKQFELLKEEYCNNVVSEFEKFVEEAKDERGMPNVMLDYIRSLSKHRILIKGINNHKVESKMKLRERLTGLAKSPKEFLFFDGAMCYSRRFPDVEATIEHKCPTCGKIYKYKDWVYDDNVFSDRYAFEERRVDERVAEIKALGYDVFVEHMCKSCYEKKYGVKENRISINVLNFKHVDDESYITNIVSSEDCMILAEFLKGNNAYKGSQDETIWINKSRNIVERLLGIKVEEE